MFVDTLLRPQGEQVDAVAPSKLKLSEAIRIGTKLRPQCRGEFFRDGGSCAMGAAMEAAGVKPFSINDDFPANALSAFPSLFWDENQFTPLADKIYKRNDGGESRESIADWLEARGL